MKEKSERLYEPLMVEDLRILREYGIEEHEAFFKRNPHLKNAYYDNLIGIFLCQGAALHFLNPSIGIKDFDIWHFYTDNEEIGFPYRGHKRIEDGYKGRPIDFLKRAIPETICDAHEDDIGKIVMEYLLEKNTKTKIMMLKKAVIGLYPDKVFNQILWKGERYPDLADPSI